MTTGGTGARSHPTQGNLILSAWRVHLRDGTRVDLPAGPLPTDLAAHERAEEVAVALLKSLAV